MTYWIKAANGPRLREVKIRPANWIPIPGLPPVSWGSYVVLPTPDWIVPYRVCRQYKGATYYLVHMYDGNETECEWTIDPRKATLFDREGAINESSYYEARYMEAA